MLVWHSVAVLAISYFSHFCVYVEMNCVNTSLSVTDAKRFRKIFFFFFFIHFFSGGNEAIFGSLSFDFELLEEHTNWNALAKCLHVCHRFDQFRTKRIHFNAIAHSNLFCGAFIENHSNTKIVIVIIFTSLELVAHCDGLIWWVVMGFLALISTRSASQHSHNNKFRHRQHLSLSSRFSLSPSQNEQMETIW